MKKIIAYVFIAAFIILYCSTAAIVLALSTIHFATHLHEWQTQVLLLVIFICGGFICSVHYLTKNL